MDQGRRLYHDLVMMQLYWGMMLIMALAQAPKSSTPLTAGPCRGAFQRLRLMPPTPYLQFEIWKLLFEIWSLEFEVEPWNVKLEIRNPSFEAGSLKVETWNLKVEATLPSQIVKTSENLWKSLKIFEDDVSMSYDSQTISQWDMIFKVFQRFSRIFKYL